MAELYGEWNGAASDTLLEGSDRSGFHRADGLTVLLAGRLHDLPPGMRGAEYVAQVYTPDSLEYAGRLNGEFAAVIVDARADQMVLLRDRIGLRPIYYTRAGERLRFASAVKHLLWQHGVVRRPNPRALAELYLGARWFAPGETLFDGIQVLPPAHGLVARRTSVRVIEHWRPAPTEYGPESADYRAEFRHFLTQAVQRRLHARNAVSVSGGLDSSSIFCLAARQCGADTLFPFTYSPADGSAADEHVYLRALEQHTGRTITRLPYDSTWNSGAVRDWIWHGELPIVPLPIQPHLQAATFTRQHDARVVFDGGWADPLLSPDPPVYLWELLRSLRFRTLRRHGRTYLRSVARHSRPELRRWMLRSLVRQITPQSVLDWRRPRLNRSVARDVFTPELQAALQPRELWDEYLPARLSPHARAIFSTVRLPYHTIRIESAAKHADMLAQEYALPFLDADLIQFLLRVPPTVLQRNGMYKALLRDSMRGMVPDLVLDRPDKGDYTTHYEDAALLGFADMLETVSASRLAIELGIFDPAALDRRIDQMRRTVDPRTCSDYLFDLYALVVWLDVFFGTARPQGATHGEAGTEAR